MLRGPRQTTFFSIFRKLPYTSLAHELVAACGWRKHGTRPWSCALVTWAHICLAVRNGRGRKFESFVWAKPSLLVDGRHGSRCSVLRSRRFGGLSGGQLPRRGAGVSPGGRAAVHL